MQLSRKWLSAGLAAVLLAGVLSGCSKTPADQAFKQAATNAWGDAYNYEGRVAVELKADDTAVLGTKGGLSAEEAQQDLQLAEALKTPDGQQMLAALQAAKLNFNGAVDGKNLKYDLVVNADFEYQGKKNVIKLPVMLDLRTEPTLYIDPTVMQSLTGMPMENGGKLLKLTLNDIPQMTAEQKAKFKADGPVLKKLKDIINSTLNGLDAKMFQDADVSEAAKKAGAERTIRLTMTREQSEKMTREMFDKILDQLGPDFNLTAEEIANAKKAIIDSQKSGANAYLGDSVADYSLNSEGKIVYISSVQNYRGAKHTGKATVTAELKNYGKPTFTLDPAKQGTIGLKEMQENMQRRLQTPPPAELSSAPQAETK